MIRKTKMKNVFALSIVLIWKCEFFERAFIRSCNCTLFSNAQNQHLFLTNFLSKGTQFWKQWDSLDVCDGWAESAENTYPNVPEKDHRSAMMMMMMMMMASWISFP